MYLTTYLHLWPTLIKHRDEQTLLLYLPQKETCSIDCGICFQAILASLVYLTAICNGLTSGYSAVLLPQLRANNSGFEINEEIESWIGKSMNLFRLQPKLREERRLGRLRIGCRGECLELRGSKRQEGGGNCIMKGFIIRSLHQILFT